MSKANTPKQRAYRARILAWVGDTGAFIFFLLAWVYAGDDFFDYGLMASLFFAVCGLLLGIYSLCVAASRSAWWASIFAALVLGVYGLGLYLMRDFCVVC